MVPDWQMDERDKDVSEPVRPVLNNQIRKREKRAKRNNET